MHVNFYSSFTQNIQSNNYMLNYFAIFVYFLSQVTVSKYLNILMYICYF